MFLYFLSAYLTQKKDTGAGKPAPLVYILTANTPQRPGLVIGYGLYRGLTKREIFDIRRYRYISLILLGTGFSACRSPPFWSICELKASLGGSR
jgi:hypothetical protein